MELNLQKFLGICLSLLSVISLSQAKKDKALYCGACLAIVEEINQAIARVDPKKRIQVGSFRVDANGNQDLKEVPYSRSDVHLSEQFDNVCGKMFNYGLAKNQDPKKRKKIYIRKYAADGTMVSSDSANFDDTVTKQMKYACEEILENFEDEMTKLFKDDKVENEKKICVKELEFCTEEDVTEKLWAQAQAVMAGMKEKADEVRDEAEAQSTPKAPQSELDDDDFDKDDDDDDDEDDAPEPMEEPDKIVMTDGEAPTKDEL